jgi:Spy/CpxP family protein refolding chaperone
MNKLSVLLTTVFFSFAISLPVLADSSTNSKSCSCPMMMKTKGMMDKLNLTEEQKNQIMAIKAKYKEQMKSNRAGYTALVSKMHELIKSDKIDESKLEELVNQKKELVAAQFKLKIQMKHEIYHVLAPSQQQQLDAMMQDTKPAKSN